MYTINIEGCTCSRYVLTDDRRDSDLLLFTPIKMKAVFLLAVLAVLGVSHSAVVKSPSLRYNLNLGYISPGDRLLQRSYLYQPGIPNTIQRQDSIYRGNATTRITAIQAFEIGYTQFAVPSLVSGGIGYNNATVRATSAVGYGFYYEIDIWGR